MVSAAILDSRVASRRRVRWPRLSPDSVAVSVDRLCGEGLTDCPAVGWCASGWKLVRVPVFGERRSGCLTADTANRAAA